MFPLRIVLDTNILVSSTLKPLGLQRTTLLIALSKQTRLYVSQPILDEYADVLSRPVFGISRGLRLQTLRLIKNHSHLIAPSRVLDVTTDPDDNMFLECADAARADYLITGNPRHFPAFWKKTKIISSREFLALTAPHLIQ